MAAVLAFNKEQGLTVAAADDGLGPDFSGIRAHAHLEMHEKQCTERQAEIRSSLLALHGRLDRMETSFDKRMNGISNRLWGAATAIILLLLGALGAVLFFYVIAKGVK
jgi:hypothetical protein